VDEVPVGHVTNGVHMPTWDSAAADQLWTEASGKERWHGTSATLEADLRSVSDEKLWAMRTTSRKALVEYARESIGRQMAVVAAEPEAIARTQARLDPDILTLGFARRFATYKRPNLLLHDPGRLLRILNHPERPAQLILAGKAHPADQAGQALIQEWMQFIRKSERSARVFFLADYDMLLAERLVQGVDVWINTPRRPWEACGTSGMKVLVNGGINISELDGWWAEAYTPEVGWALGDGLEHGDDPAWDAAEAEVLYENTRRIQATAADGRIRNGDGDTGRSSRLGRGRGRDAVRTARNERRGHSHRLGCANAREYGGVDAQVFREPHRARIHRATLPSRCQCVPTTRRRQGSRRSQAPTKW
jgi:starch phosphorylase